MTVEVSYSPANGIGNGVTAEFPTGWMFLANEHLTVERSADLGVTWQTYVLDVDYTVTGAGDPEPGGTVILAGALAINDLLRISRTTPVTQTTALRVNGPYLPATIMGMFDKLTLIAQEQAYRLLSLEALGDLVTVTDLADGAFAVVSFTTDADAVEESFPISVPVANAINVEGLIIISAVNSEDPAEVFDEPPVLQWANPGDGVNVTVKYISGLKPGTEYQFQLLAMY